MHRFSPGLQKATLEALERLGVEVVLGEKVVSHDDADARQVVLTSGKTVECDCYVDCTGQRPSSGVLASLAPAAISESGHIRVKPTLQILDDSLPHIYACGDVADTHTPNPNARSAMTQAETVADNILLAIRGKGPRYTYAPRWGDGLIKLTLGLDRSILQFWDGKNELLFPSVDKDVALLADGAWKNMGAEPFTDTGPMKEGLCYGLDGSTTIDSSFQD
ncbi:hypothetical protein VTK73DRAFT_9655 [Phialemonium thermophilum]|uniref:FAD/NAD(P)-binding domain-containing protein n=1 Tax=Phialemonium thermophilum TaxID=223376 RepID=A0ABR3W142_9PEZI